jgi:glycopeptide antibiotics resistance protein
VIFALVHFGEFRVLPWFLPGVAISVAISIAASGAVGRALRVRRLVALALVLSLGVILAATLTPQWEALAFGAQGPSSCDFSRISLAPLGQLLSADDSGGNILMFIPFGVAIGILPRSRRKAAILAFAIALPFAVETVQLLVPALDRACESADVVDNLTGLAIGLAGGSVAGWVATAAVRRPR